MPIEKVQGGYRWGGHGKVYPTREGAERQAAAAHANGFQGDAACMPPLLHSKDVRQDVSPPGFKGTVEAMKKHPEIDNPWALAWYMANKGDVSHK